LTSTWNNNVSSSIGTYNNGAPPQLYLDGYLTEVNFVDGQALTPSSFGETDTITGVWKPKKYAGTYGTNGFYLNFSDNSAATAAAIGKDSSGNGNNWTPNNISVTAGVTYDSMLDVPTMYADGGNGRGNYAVLNPLAKSSGVTSVTDGNLAATGSSYPHNILSSIAFPSSGKFYTELFSSTATNASVGIGFGVQSAAAGVNADYNAAGSYKFYASAGPYVVSNGTVTAISAGYTNTANQTFKIAADVDSGKVWIGQNNTWWDSAGGITGNPSTGANPTFTVAIADFFVVAHFNSNGSFTWTANFGQRPFALTPPTGFKALNTQNLPDATIKKGNAYFDVTTYTGNGSTQSIVNSGAMQPDFTWVKSRSNGAYTHILQDSVRGVGNFLISAATSAEAANSQMVTSYNSNGFTVNVNGNVNANAETYVAWQWKESVSAGFDIVTYQANGSANRAIAHSLGVAPKFIIVKDRSAVVNWNCWFTGFTANEYLQLNTTAAKGSYSTLWYQTPDSSNFYIGSTGTGVNLTSGNNYVAYLFAEVAGYSKFGSYTGNGSTDGPFVYLGFRPKFVMVKRTDAINGNWEIFDSTRSTYNVDVQRIFANDSSAELTGELFDMLSNGFKCRLSGTSDSNTSGGTYIYAAFAENPFKNSLAR
jgi:hypothetical protein